MGPGTRSICDEAPLMYLRSLTLKGFKSFPDRTRLEFGPGVSVVIGPNGSGKSNITDAVLWALGEQSPLVVRGSSMQDVIFGGGPGVQPRSAAEVELVLDNSDGAVALPLSEVAIVRRLERSGEGEYRLGGARCRLIDVVEALSDTGLGKETHSVVSQGRIESIVTSKPRERRLLIEEAAGLSKHRKRRRRAQLKLERTEQNLDRALDVEREVRSRLRPLARQAQAAELHERLERQLQQARLELTRHRWLTASAELEQAQASASVVREARTQIDAELAAVLARRTAVERTLAERSEQRDALTQHLYGSRSALERLHVRAEQARTLRDTLGARIAASDDELARLRHAADDGRDAEAGREAERRVRALEDERARLEESAEGEQREQTAERQREHDEIVAERTRLEGELDEVRAARDGAAERLRAERTGRSWERSWSEVRRVISEGVRRALALGGENERERALGEVVDQAEAVALRVVERALGQVEVAEQAHADGEEALRALERRLAEVAERERRSAWLIGQRREAAEHGSLALQRAQLEGELVAERRALERVASERRAREVRLQSVVERRASDCKLAPLSGRLIAAIEAASGAVSAHTDGLQTKLAAEGAGGAEIAEQLRACAREEAEVQARLRGAGEAVTKAEVDAQRSIDRCSEVEAELREIAGSLGLTLDAVKRPEAPEPTDEELEAIGARIERLARRRERLGPVNPVAQEEYADAQAHAQELAAHREDLEAALRELRAVIRDADRQIRETFEATFESVASSFREVIGEVFPGGSGRLRLVADEPAARPVLTDAAAGDEHAGAGTESEAEDEPPEEQLAGVEIEVTPAGKSTKRLSLLSGGEKAMTALAFLFAVFLARPCPFYVLDEVEAALDEHNLDRFLALLRRCAARAQFIVMTHQKRTMEAANWLYGVSMGSDGVSKVISRRLEPLEPEQDVEGEPRAARDEGAPGAPVRVAAEPASVGVELEALTTRVR
jgi:chromosome segregation protein